MAQHPDLPWLSLSALPADAPTLDPAVAAQLLCVCAELLAATFVVLQHEISSMDGWNMLRHLRRAQDEVQAAQAWQAQGEGG